MDCLFDVRRTAVFREGNTMDTNETRHGLRTAGGEAHTERHERKKRDIRLIWIHFPDVSLLLLLERRENRKTCFGPRCCSC